MPLPASVRYTRVAIALHWLTAALIIFMFIFGEDLMDRHATESSGATWHASIGVSILVLTTLRLFWRAGHPAPVLPITMKPWELGLAKLTHLAIYVGLVAIPLTGLLSFAHFLQRAPALADATLFGIIPIPLLTFLEVLPTGELHEIGSKLMIVLVLLHVAAALKHQFIDRDNVLSRMR